MLRFLAQGVSTRDMACPHGWVEEKVSGYHPVLFLLLVPEVSPRSAFPFVMKQGLQHFF